MTLYELPAMPSGPLWDKDGNKWWINESFRNWTDDGMSYRTWSELLWVFGPLTDVPPAPAVGDTVSLAQLADLPLGSVAATWNTAFTVTSEAVFATGVSGALNPTRTVTDVFDSLTLLRLGRGDDA